MSIQKKWLVASTVVIASLVPARASADWMFSPYVGPTFEAATGLGDFANAIGRGRPVTFGGAFGVLGPAVGLEVDLGHTPRFFEEDTFLEEVARSSVTTVMINGVVGIPGRASGAGIRPYASGGAGWIRSRIGDALGIVAVGETTPGFNVGGGVIGFVSDQVGIRGDVRYFGAFGGDESGILDSVLRELSFWRGTIGVAFRF